MSPAYTSELYKPFNHGHNTRRSNCRLQLPYRNTSYGHKALSFLGLKLWNNLPAYIKSSSNIINTFIQTRYQKAIFQRTSKERRQCLFYYKGLILTNLFQISDNFPGNCMMKPLLPPLCSCSRLCVHFLYKGPL